MYRIGDKKYISVCTVTAQDGGGLATSATIYRTAYRCGRDDSKTPPRPPHQLAMRSVDRKNPEGLGPPAFTEIEQAAESEAEAAQAALADTRGTTQPVADDIRVWDDTATDGAVFTTLFWHNPQSYTGEVAVPVAEAAGGKGCFYDVIKRGPDTFELGLHHDGNQNSASVSPVKAGWWVECASV
jgi:hypothetical protein